MEEEIKQAYPSAEVRLKEGDSGIFEVSLDGEIIFSKLKRIGTKEDRFPHPKEIVGIIEEKLA